MSEKYKLNDVIFPSGCEERAINLGNKNLKIGIFTGGTSVRSKNIFTDISRYPTGKHEISYDISFRHCRLHGGFHLPFIIFRTLDIILHCTDLNLLFKIAKFIKSTPLRNTGT